MMAIAPDGRRFASYSEHMPQGTVKFFNDDKGYGFITPDEGGKDIFVHIKSCNGDIAENDVVSYEVEETPKGLSATKGRSSDRLHTTQRKGRVTPAFFIPQIPPPQSLTHRTE